MDEEWKVIANSPCYEVSNLGRVRRGDKVLSTKLMKGLYVMCSLMCGEAGNRHAKTFSIHRLVAEAFLPNPDNKEQVDHIDRNKHNNVVSNLRWATRSENQWNRSRNDDQYIRQVWRVQWTKDGEHIQREFSTEADARAFRLAELGF